MDHFRAHFAGLGCTTLFSVEHTNGADSTIFQFLKKSVPSQDVSGRARDRCEMKTLCYESSITGALSMRKGGLRRVYPYLTIVLPASPLRRSGRCLITSGL